MRLARLAVLLAVTTTATAAHAGDGPAAPPRIESIDHGTSVEIIAHGAIAADAAKVAVVRERVEIPLANAAPDARRIVEDTTALLAEIRGDAPRVLSVKLRHDHAHVIALAGAVTFTQVGDDLHLTIPRTPTAIAPITPAIEQIAPPPPPAAEPPPRALAPIVTSPTTPPAAAPAIAATTTAPAAPIAGATAPGATGGRWWMILGGLGLVGGGITIALRRKRNALPIENQLEIIATRSLGGKSRVVWLAAGDHEIVIAISPQQIRPLARWSRRIANANANAGANANASVSANIATNLSAYAGTALERSRSAPVDRSFGRALDDAGADLGFAPRPAAEPASTRSSSSIPRMRTVSGGGSPAISGLLRLRDRERERTPPPPPMPTDTLSDDQLEEDAQWARDILEASGGRR